MKKAFCLATLLATSFVSIDSFAQVNFPSGRIALSHDGNIEDDDDIIALPLELALLDAAGLKNKLTHVEYNNNTCGGPNTVQEDNNDKAAYAGNDAQHMRESVQGAIDRYAYNSSLFYDYTTKANAAQTHLVAEINMSSASNPLYIIAAGPMETVWRALNASDKTKHQNVYVISHSKWNQNYARCNASKHTWATMAKDFPNVFFVANGNQNDNHHLPDQNTNLNTDISIWNWMNSDPKATANTKWLFTRNPFSGKFDPSDAGMVYYVLSGGPLHAGNKKPTVTDIKNLLFKAATSGGGTTPPPTLSPKAPVVNFLSPMEGSAIVGTSIVVETNASDSDGTISNVKLYLDGVFVRQENSSPYRWNTTNGGSIDAVLSNLTTGIHELKAIATDNTGQIAEATISITIQNSQARIGDEEINVSQSETEVKIGLSSAQLMDAKVFNLAGTNLYTTQATDIHSLTLSKQGLAPGIYIVRMNTDRGMVSKKIVVNE